MFGEAVHSVADTMNQVSPVISLVTSLHAYGQAQALMYVSTMTLHTCASSTQTCSASFPATLQPPPPLLRMQPCRAMCASNPPWTGPEAPLWGNLQLKAG